MARLPRLTLPGYPHHIIQRGNNRQLIFADTQDFETMLALLGQNAQKFAVALHAYVLMDNHFHLLATPSTAEALPLMMQAVGRSYVRYFNQRHARSNNWGQSTIKIARVSLFRTSPWPACPVSRFPHTRTTSFSAATTAR